MKPQFINQISSSFYHAVDHELLSKGAAFTNYSGSLSYKLDPSVHDRAVFGSPFRQWVADSSISGAVIPSGAYSSSLFIPRGTSGLAIDFDFGRISFSGNVGQNSKLSLPYSFKDYNIYFTEATDETLLFESKFCIRPKSAVQVQSTGALENKDLPYPCIFIRLQDINNSPFSFGGLDDTNTSIRCVVLADSSYLLDAGLSIMNDMARKSIPCLDFSDLPFGVNGDFKSGNSYNYISLCSNYSQNRPSSMSLIKTVDISKFSATVNRQIGDGIFAGFADFEILTRRSPRI